MSRSHRLLIIVVGLLAAAAVPAGADAGGGAHRLGGSPQMFLTDGHHATIKFASARLPSKPGGGYRATIRFDKATDARVTTIKATGRHGSDVVYSAKVTARDALKAGTKYRVTFTLDDGSPQRVFVKAYDR
jgi:hypothetical protein